MRSTPHALPLTRAGTRDWSLGMPAPRMVGRERELVAMERVLDCPPVVVLVEGEAGIGKSRLVREFLATPAAAASRAVVAVCPPYREGLTLSPIVDAMRRVRDRVAGLRLSPLAGALRPLFPEWGDDLPPMPEPMDDARASRHRLLRALAELLDALGVGLLVVEDAHWADDATLEFLLFLVASQQPLMLVVTYRPEDVAAGSVLSRLSAGAGGVRIRLDQLEVSHIAGLVSSMSDDEPVSDSFAELLREHTAGIPLAVEETVRLLKERSDLIRRDGQWVHRSLAGLQVPLTVRDSTLERLQRLAADARWVLQAAAVAATPVLEPVLREVAGLPPDRARVGIGQGLASGLLREDDLGRLHLRHALMARAIYEAIRGPERRRLHHRAGEALERTDPLPVAHLSRHFREAGDVERWCRYAELAADQAIAADDRTTAVRLLAGLLAGAAGLPPRRRASIGGRLGAAVLARNEGIDDLHRQAMAILRELLTVAGLSRRDRAEIRNPLGRLLMRADDVEAGWRELARAVPDLGHLPSEQLHAMRALAHPAGIRPAAVHLRWLRRACGVDPGLLTPLERMQVAADEAYVLLILGREEGWSAAAGLRSVGSTAEERREVTRAQLNVGKAAMLWGHYDRARQHLGGALDLATAPGMQRYRHIALADLALLDWLVGAWDGLGRRAAGLIDEAEAVEIWSGNADLVVWWLRAAGDGIHRAPGELAAQLAMAQQRRSLHRALDIAAELGRLRLAEGDADEAVRVTDWVINGVAAKGVWLWATEVAPVRAEALVAAGRREEAQRMVKRFAAGIRGRRAFAARAALETCRAYAAGGMDHPLRAAAAFGRAAQEWDRLPRPYDVLRARERQASLLIAGGETDAGLRLRSEVFDGLTGLGAAWDAGRVARDLRASGVGVRRRGGGRRSYGDQLSPRELEVVRLLVTGRTDRQIAEKLFLSPKTVGRHLESARRKLDAPSRIALVVKAVEAGLVEERAPAGSDGAGPGNGRRPAY